MNEEAKQGTRSIEVLVDGLPATYTRTVGLDCSGFWRVMDRLTVRRPDGRVCNFAAMPRRKMVLVGNHDNLRESGLRGHTTLEESFAGLRLDSVRRWLDAAPRPV